MKINFLVNRSTNPQTLVSKLLFSIPSHLSRYCILLLEQGDFVFYRFAKFQSLVWIDTFWIFPGKNSVSISLTCSSKYYYVAFGNRDGSGINEFIWKCNVEGSHNMRSGGGAVLVPLLWASNISHPTPLSFSSSSSLAPTIVYSTPFTEGVITFPCGDISEAAV